MRPLSRLTVAVLATSTLTLAAAVWAGGPASADPVEQVTNGSFTSAISPWTSYGVTTGSAKLVDGAFCADVPSGTTNPWDVGVLESGIPGVKGSGYTLSFKAKATAATSIQAVFQHASGSYETVTGGAVTLGTDWKTYTFTGTSTVDFTDGQVTFQLGGKGAYTFCLDDVSLQGGVEIPAYVPDTGPRVRVNQVGYLPNGPKSAVVVTDSSSAVTWQLKSSAGTVVASGSATPRGSDASSGQKVQTIDFSKVTTAGTGYTLTADGATSHPFAISGDGYAKLRKDALLPFYTGRSGIEIKDSIAPGYGRKAGHIGVAPNKGDTAVGCLTGATFLGDWTCPSGFTKDVSGGWYDAGDHGKYVVNGGISVAQLLGEYERTQVAARSNQKASADSTATAAGGPRGRKGKFKQLANPAASALGDGSLAVPEVGNGIPDILDEARWELDFLLKMQVPAGQQYAGMAYHKMHDSAWTGLPMDPAADSMTRELHRPSTAAALNLAAAAAQGSRVFAPFDKEYAAKLLSAAETAYAAAKANPDVLAPEADGTGGGTYSDTTVSDEFYWAAAELYLATGKSTYQSDVTSSPLHTATTVFSDGGSFYWGGTAALGRLDLATVPSSLPDRDKVRASVLTAADSLVSLVSSQAYGMPYHQTGEAWSWGSNSGVLNNIVVLATAYDLSGKTAYRDAALTGLDFILGKNALNISYVTGYGSHYAQNQHSRWYANQLDPSLPHPPAGTLAGGPNTALQDPLAESKLKGCVGQMCYIDDINSYSTNELAINWNAPLAWVAAWAADQATAH